MPKTPEQIAREAIDRRLIDAGWVIQDMNKINLSAALGVAIREFPTSTGPVDYALFVAGKPVGVVEAKKDTEAQNTPWLRDSPSGTPTVLLSIWMKAMRSGLPMRPPVP